LKDSVLKAYIC